MLSEKRDKQAALSFFNKAIYENGFPEKLTIDKSGANKSCMDDINLFLTFLSFLMQTKESDIYSYGVVLWELGSRKFPFANQHNVKDHVLSGHQETVSRDTPPKMAELIGKCWLERNLRPTVDTAVEIVEEEFAFLI